MTRFHRVLAQLLLVAACTGCASTQQEPNPDPFEGVNRVVFAFNDNVDRFVAAPVARRSDAMRPDAWVWSEW